jgi:hypothetical protein
MFCECEEELRINAKKIETAARTVCACTKNVKRDLLERAVKYQNETNTDLHSSAMLCSVD